MSGKEGTPEPLPWLRGGLKEQSGAGIGSCCPTGVWDLCVSPHLLLVHFFPQAGAKREKLLSWTLQVSATSPGTQPGVGRGLL